jgi:hypothetical protein
MRKQSGRSRAKGTAIGREVGTGALREVVGVARSCSVLADLIERDDASKERPEDPWQGASGHRIDLQRRSTVRGNPRYEATVEPGFRARRARRRSDYRLETVIIELLRGERISHRHRSVARGRAGSSRRMAESGKPEAVIPGMSPSPVASQVGASIASAPAKVAPGEASRGFGLQTELRVERLVAPSQDGMRVTIPVPMGFIASAENAFVVC